MIAANKPSALGRPRESASSESDAPYRTIQAAILEYRTVAVRERASETDAEASSGGPEEATTAAAAGAAAICTQLFGRGGAGTERNTFLLACSTRTGEY